MRNLFLRIALKGIFAALKIRDEGILSISVNDRVICPFREDILQLVKFHENKTLTKISEFTVKKRWQSTRLLPLLHDSAHILSDFHLSIDQYDS